MAQYFANLVRVTDPFDGSKEIWKVTQVVAVGNDIPANGDTLENNPNHVDGENWCANWFKGGMWKQTHKNGLRKQFAGHGMSYDFAKDKFLNAQNYASWTLDENDEYQAPVTYPTITTYSAAGVDISYSIFWDDDNLMWKALDRSSPNNLFSWNTETLSWDQE
tara:strand:+ start:1051 stop:1539 length:489 start_codon:yes stop_codon:yes gene_type:complete